MQHNSVFLDWVSKFANGKWSKMKLPGGKRRNLLSNLAFLASRAGSSEQLANHRLALGMLS